MKAITFWHIHNVEILSYVPLSMEGCKMKVILQLCCVVLNSCASENPLPEHGLLRQYSDIFEL